MKNTQATFKLNLLAIGAMAVLAGPLDAACSSNTDGLTADWNDVSWNAGATSRTVTVPYNDGDGDMDVSFIFSGATNRFNSGYPQVSTMFSGGKGTSQRSLGVVSNFANNSEQLTLTVNFPDEVENLEFTIFDIDYLANSGGGGFRDLVTVTGVNAAGSSVSMTRMTPYYTPPGPNTAPSTVYTGPAVASNQGTGNSGNAENDQDLGNMTVTFNGPVKSFDLIYQNGPAAYAPSGNPQSQGIALYDLEFCNPRESTTVETTKTISVYRENPLECDQIPGSPDPEAELAIPGACVEYVITASNLGPGTANDLTIVDDLPPHFVYSAARFFGFDNDGPDYGLSTPAPGQDCAASICSVTLNDARLNNGQTGTIEIRAIVK